MKIAASNFKTWAFGLVCLAALTVATVLSAPAQAENISFPSDAGAINVASYAGIDLADNGNDDTAAIQKAISDNIDQNKILYFPNGTYNISDTLIWKQNGSSGPGTGGYKAFLSFQGQSRSGVIFKLKNSCSGFTDAAAYKPVIETGYIDIYNNTGFCQNLRNFTVDIGNGNAGAVGIRYRVSNQGSLSDVTIRTSDSNGGQLGVDLTQPEPGPGMLRNISVQGFRVGIAVARAQYGMTMENITLSGQRDQALYNNANALSIHNLQSTNTCEAVRSDDGLGLVVLLDSTLSGGGSANNAINYRGHLVARNVTTSGYAKAISPIDGGTSINGGTVGEFVSSPAAELFPSTKRTLGLAIEDTPQFNQEDTSKWVKVATSNDDITQPLRDAIATANSTGKDTVYVPHTGNRDHFRISDTIVVTGGVRRITFMGQTIRTTGSIQNDGTDRAVFKVQSTGANITFDNVYFAITGTYSRFTWFDQNTTTPLILRSILADGGNVYRNSTGLGKLYVEDVCGGGYKITGGQKVWARQLNCETTSTDAVPDGSNFTEVLNNASTLWVLGYKGEKELTAITTNGGGSTELLGGLSYPARSVPAANAAFIVDNSRATFSYTTIAYGDGQDYTVQVRETQGTTTKEYGGNGSSLSVKALWHGIGSAVPLFCANPAPVGTGTGLTGKYYGDKNLTTLIKTQIDPQVDFDWGNGSPRNLDGSAMSSVGPDNFSICWTGQVQAMEAGTYTFQTSTDDGVRLYLNGATTPQINKWIDQSPTSYTTTMTLSVGQKIPIKMEYYESGGGASARLWWKRPGTTAAVAIPSAQLYPTVPGPNLVANPGFESEQFNTQTPSGWSEWSGYTTDAGYTESYGGSYNGNYHGTHWNPNDYNMYTYQTKTGLTNGLYTLRCWAKSSGGQTTCYLEAKDFGGTARTNNLPVSSSYQLVEIKDINVTNNQCTIGVWSVAFGNNFCYFDDFEFFKQ